MDFSFPVELLRSSGTTKSISLRFSSNSEVSFLAERGEVLLSCHWENILRWKVADRRKQTPSLARCLDIQIQTDSGAQILRLRCINNSDFDNLREILSDKLDRSSRKETVTADNVVLVGEVKGQTNGVVSETVTETNLKHQKKSKNRKRSEVSKTQEVKDSQEDSEECEKSRHRKEKKKVMLRSIGAMLRSQPSPKKEVPPDSIPVNEETETALQNNVEDENTANTESRCVEAEDEERSVVEEARVLKTRLNQALNVLQTERPENAPILEGDLDSLQGKMEIFRLENERLQLMNQELVQSMSEKRMENQTHKEMLETIQEANEDIFSKFEALRSDLQVAKTNLRNKEGESHEMEAKIKDLETERSKWLLEKDSGEKTQNELTEERNRDKEQLSLLSSTVASLQVENEDLKQKFMSMEEVFHEERKVKEEAEASSSSAALQIHHLAETLARKEGTLRDLQKTENERLKQVREALEKAENEHHEATLCRKREHEKDCQLELLSHTISEQRKEITNSLEAQWRTQLDEARRQSTKLDTEVSSMKTEMVKSDLEIKQLLHEKELLEKRVEQLTTNMTSSQISCSLTGINVHSILELEKIQKLEMDRQRAVDELRKLHNEYDNLKRQSEHSTKRLKAETEQLNVQVKASCEQKFALEAESVRLKQELEALASQLKVEKANAAAVEARLKQQCKTMTDEFSRKLEKYNAKGGRAFEQLQNQLHEAAELITEKDKVQGKWKEETKKIARQLEELAKEHQQEKEEAEKETSTLKSELKKANAYSAELSKTIIVVKRQHGALKQQLRDVLQDTEILEQHYHRLQERYTHLEEDYSAAKSNMKKLEESKVQLERERDSFGLRYETIRRKQSSHTGILQ